MANTRMRILMSFCLTACIATAKAEEIPDPGLSIDRVAIFKNGLGYFTAKATLPDEITSIRFGKLPTPSHGTFWVGYDPDTPVKGVFTRLEEVQEPKTVENLYDLLTANVGRDVKLVTGHNPQNPIAGMLLKVTQGTSNPPLHSDLSGHVAQTRDHNGQSIALVVTNAGIEAVKLSAVQHCLISKGGVKTQYLEAVIQPVLRLELDQPAGGKEISVSYLAHGITWAPSYLIDLDNPDTAKLSAKAVIVNEAIDLNDVTLELVSGSPNLPFAQVSSPVAMTQTLEPFLHSLHHIPPQSHETEASFLYPLYKVTLKYRETAYFPLFTAELPYEHVYLWEIPDLIRPDHRRETPHEKTQPHEVWHAYRLTNTTDMPLTTAPAQLVKNGQILGQNTYHHTNPGDQTTLKINRAMQIFAQHTEHETHRKTNASKHADHHYDKVTIKGQLKLLSRIDQPVGVEVVKQLSGSILNTTDQPEILTMPEGLKGMNATHQITWEIQLEPNQEKILDYKYTALIKQ